jgi:hypothetical protein
MWLLGLWLRSLHLEACNDALVLCCTANTWPQVFLYMFYIVVFFSSVFMCFKGRKQWERKRDKYDVYAES